jgi:hypothetical protein
MELPAATVWPLVLALGITLLALGLVTNPAFCAVGGVIFLAGLGGWIGQLLPGRGHVHEPIDEHRPSSVVGTVGTVEHLRPGAPGFRFQLPLKVRPISAGVRGGIVGGLVMPIPALLYGLISGHGIWFPINLLSAMVIPTLEELDVAQLEKFRLSALVVGIVIHAVFSIGFGLLYGVVLPTLPDIGGLGPIYWGGILMPVLWTGLCYGLMGIVNPALEEHVDWRWFLASQFAYGIAMAIVVFRTEQIPIPPAGERERREDV